MQLRERKGLILCRQKSGFDNKLSHSADFQSPKAISHNRSLELIEITFETRILPSVNSSESSRFGSLHADRKLHENLQCCSSDDKSGT